MSARKTPRAGKASKASDAEKIEKAEKASDAEKAENVEKAEKVEKASEAEKTEKASEADVGGPRGSGLAATKWSAGIGLIAAMVLAMVANVLAARHYKRWDLTRHGLYTLSTPTLQTLGSLQEPIEIYVLLPTDDPLRVSLDHLFQAYQAETSRLSVKLTDPDRHPAEFLAVQKRFGIEAGKSADGRILTDTAVIVARGDKVHYITVNDLVVVLDGEDVKTRPRLEESLTTGIRAVLGGERPRVCFATGHGEKPLDEGGAAGLAALKARLTKNNYDVLEIAPAKTAEKEELKGCQLLVICGPTEPVPAEDVARYKGFVAAGGSLFLAAGPIPDADDKAIVDLKLDELYAALGLVLHKDFVFETDPRRKEAQGFGETFFPTPKLHPTTEGVLKVADAGIGVTLTITSSLSRTATSAATPLFVTSDKAFGMTDFFAWAKNPTEPVAKEGDTKGPLTVAYAVELPKPEGSSAPRGARAVVVGSTGILVSTNWQSDDLRGTAMFVESAISWLASKPELVSLPPKPAVSAGLRLSEEDVSGVGRYVLLYMPLAMALLGGAVLLWRRGGEKRGKASKASGGDPGDGDSSGEEKP